MNNKEMTILGIGPKLAGITIPYLIITIVLTILYPVFKLEFIPGPVRVISGIIWLAIGLVFYILTVKTFFKEYKKGKLIKTGTFSVCRNPIYTTFILFILPSVSLLTNSWLNLTSAILLYAVFKKCIHSEYDYLKEKFGSEYDKYEKSVNEILPIPRRGV